MAPGTISPGDVPECGVEGVVPRCHEKSLSPDGFARGNGRIEADLVDVSTRLPGRVTKAEACLARKASSSVVPASARSGSNLH